jgi:hypothetical protein
LEGQGENVLKDLIEMASYEPLGESSKWQKASLGHKIALYVLCYVIWAALVALAVLSAILIREAYLAMLPVWGPWLMTGIDRFAVLFIVLALLCYVIFLEHYLRRGVVRGQLRARSVRAALWQIPVAAILYLVGVTIRFIVG